MPKKSDFKNWLTWKHPIYLKREVSGRKVRGGVTLPTPPQPKYFVQLHIFKQMTPAICPAAAAATATAATVVTVTVAVSVAVAIAIAVAAFI